MTNTTTANLMKKFNSTTIDGVPFVYLEDGTVWAFKKDGTISYDKKDYKNIPSFELMAVLVQ